MREKLKRTVLILGTYSLLIVAASLFSVPFPFVRQLWIREILGVSGLIHALLLYLISKRIEKASLVAAAAGLGLVVNEQAVTWRSFVYLLKHGTVSPGGYLFLTGSSLFSFFLIWILIDISVAIYRFRLTKADRPQDAESENPQKIYDDTNLATLAWIASGYLVTIGCICAAFYFNRPPQYGALKVIGSFAGVFSFAGIGQELSAYLHRKQTRFFCGVKMASHFLMLIGIFWIIYRHLPIASVLISG